MPEFELTVISSHMGTTRIDLKAASRIGGVQSVVSGQDAQAYADSIHDHFATTHHVPNTVRVTRVEPQLLFHFSRRSQGYIGGRSDIIDELRRKAIVAKQVAAKEGEELRLLNLDRYAIVYGFDTPPQMETSDNMARLVRIKEAMHTSLNDSFAGTGFFIETSNVYAADAVAISVVPEGRDWNQSDYREARRTVESVRPKAAVTTLG